MPPPASVETISKPHEARTRQLTGPQPQAQLSDEDLDRLVELRNGRPRVRLVPGNEVPGTRYRIDGWLGDGGTGVVYEATHEDLGRKVAIKVLHTEHSEDPEMLQTFREEARAATKIGSPYIVEVIDFAELPDGRLLYVMERLRGISLDREVKQAPMDPKRLIAIFRQACKGLAAAHDAGLVHRDVKPEHLLVLDEHEPQAHGRRDRIKIMDFGIAAVVGQAVDIQGTPSYMAPEQVLGMGVARQNDIYSLGCSMYELLVGRPPFRGETLKDILRAHMRETPKPPRELVPGEVVHPALEAVVLKCLAKKRVERYPDMRELEAALLEAQLAAGIRTDWDDLAVPDVEAARKAKIEAGLAELRVVYSTEKRRSWWIPALLGACIAGAAATMASFVWLTPEPTLAAQAVSRVDTLASEARDAAARALFIYPPSGDTEVPTAFRKVTELEQLEDPQERELGLARGQALRQEFADTLVRIGDHYWVLDHGRPFAIDYYIQALVFDATRVHARERASAMAGELIELERKARDGSFSRPELEAGEVLAALAAEDRDTRKEKAQQWQKSRAQAASSSIVRDARIEALFRKEGLVEPVPVPVAPPLPPPSLESLTDALAEAILDNRLPEPGDDPLEETRRSPKAAKTLAARGHEALRAGAWDEASRLFHSALQNDHNSASALIGLSDLYFEKAEHGRAVDYAKRAVAIEPRRASYRIKYGDALLKVLQYAAAREQYQAAVRLGSKLAPGRLQRIEDKIGG